MNNKIGIVICLHGNEQYGLEIKSHLEYKYPFFIGNKRAIKENVRYIDSDMNRVFPGKYDGNHEESMAFDLLQKLNPFEYLIDIHSSNANVELFGIITKVNDKKIEFAKSLGLKKLVIMSENIANNKSLIDHVNCGISLEVGSHSRGNNVKDVLEILNNLEKQEKNHDIEIYEVFNVMMVNEFTEILLENFKLVKEGEIIVKSNNEDILANEDFIPILVGEKYTNNFICFKARKI